MRGGSKGIDLRTLVTAADTLLEPQGFEDYCPNGVQVEGTRPIRRLVSGVTASLALIEAAIDAQADAIVVHHGLFWRGDDPRLVGPRRARIAALLESGVHLLAYHLPLDAHPRVGNNAQLARVLGWKVAGRGSRHGLLAWTDLRRAIDATGLAALCYERLGQAPLVVGRLERPLRRIAWCTGAAQDALDEAVALGADAYLSGEISERTTHLAREAGVVYVAAGHHATERFGVQALGAALAGTLGLEHRFIDDPNPV